MIISEIATIKLRRPTTTFMKTSSTSDQCISVRGRRLESVIWHFDYMLEVGWLVGS